MKKLLFLLLVLFVFGHAQKKVYYRYKIKSASRTTFLEVTYRADGYDVKTKKLRYGTFGWSSKSYESENPFFVVNAEFKSPTEVWVIIYRNGKRWRVDHYRETTVVNTRISYMSTGTF